MRAKIMKVLLVAAVMLGAGVFAIGPVHADGGGGGFDAKDGRYNPEVGDRLAIYITDTGVAVWGIDANLNGVYLTWFAPSEVAALAAGKTISHKVADGTVTLHQDIAAVTHVGYADYTSSTLVTVVDQAAQYTASWKGGHEGTDGSASFSKTFLADYNAN